MSDATLTLTPRASAMAAKVLLKHLVVSLIESQNLSKKYYDSFLVHCSCIICLYNMSVILCVCWFSSTRNQLTYRRVICQ